MSLTKLTANLNAHQSLPDQPSLTATELKQKWDEPVNDIKTYVNNTLTTEVDTALGTKVDKVSGKGLSTNDFTDTYKNKITSNETELGNKVDKVSGKGLSKNDFTDAYKTKLDGIATGATKNTITRGTSTPSGGSSGDIYIQYF